MVETTPDSTLNYPASHQGTRLVLLRFADQGPGVIRSISWPQKVIRVPPVHQSQAIKILPSARDIDTEVPKVLMMVELR